MPGHMNPYINLPKVPVVRGRQDIVLARCRGKRVLHVGCVDSGLLEQRYRQGDLMHLRLAQVAHELWGVDIDRQGIEFLRQLGFSNLVVGDICQPDNLEELQGRIFDVIVASEVIEHLLNPGQFLVGVQRFMAPDETELIVTVPNAFRVATLIQLLRGIEYIHPDHNYWFSYQTITNLLRKTGFTIKDIYVYSFSEGSVVLPSISSGSAPNHHDSQLPIRRVASLFHRVARQPFTVWRKIFMRLLLRWLYKRTPFWGDGIIVISTVCSPTPTRNARSCICGTLS